MSEAMQAAAKRFFQSLYFAVAGASQDQAKFGYKVLAWYQRHSLPVQPVNPKTSSITLSAPKVTLPTVPSLSSLPHPKETSLSIITPPGVTRQLLQEAQGLGVQAVWLQPGAFDDALLKWVNEEERFESFVAGEVEKTGGEGWCMLVDGEDAMRAAKEDPKRKL